MTSTEYQPQLNGDAVQPQVQVSIPNQNNASNKVKKLGAVIKGLGVCLIF